MNTNLSPGVTFEWLAGRTPAAEALFAGRAPAIEVLRTDVAGFVGIAERGPLHRPVRLDGWGQFETTFGRHIRQAFLAYAVEGFFGNGGRTCWVVRVADPTKARAARLDLLGEDGVPVLRLRASSVGAWGDGLSVIVARTGQSRFTLTLRVAPAALEVWPNLSTDPLHPRFAPAVLGDAETGSALVRAEVLAGAAGAELLPAVGRLSGGGDGLATLRAAHLIGEAGPARPWGLDALAAVDEISIVAVPDLMPKPVVETQPPPTVTPRCDDLTAPPPDSWTPPEPVFPPPLGEAELAEAQRALVAHCERLRDRVAIIDPLAGLREPRLVQIFRQSFDSSYAAVYWPWLRVPDPLRVLGLLRAVPPSGHVAGVYARVSEAGVQRPPANEVVEGAPDVEATVDDVVHGELNGAGVNVLRLFPGRGLRVAGARTLSSSPPVRYVNVRRLLLMIAEAIDERTHWVVFEPSDARLWREIDRVVRTFLDDLWRAGMLDGATAEEAYFVHCDETTNPLEETALGRMTCRIGLLPPWPAEFVVVRIAKTEAGTQIVEESGSPRG